MTNRKYPVKAYPSIACCGLDCGLCPTYYTKGPSRCPGCCGLYFFNKHPSCSIITCCVKKKGLETCAECDEFQCQKFKDWDIYDSFICHRKSIFNLMFIQENGLKNFLEQQRKRIELLEKMLNQFNEGRSKSFYCIATVLLSIQDLESALKDSKQKLKEENVKSDDLKSKSKILKTYLNEIAANEGIELKLRRK